MSNKLVLKKNSLVFYKTNNECFYCAIVRIFSFSEKFIFPFNSAIASSNETVSLSPHENIFTTALINIHYLYTVVIQPCTQCGDECPCKNWLHVRYIPQNFWNISL